MLKRKSVERFLKRIVTVRWRGELAPAGTVNSKIAALPLDSAPLTSKRISITPTWIVSSAGFCRQRRK